MFIIQKLETIHLSSSQKEVAQYILDKKLEIEKLTIQELAHQTFTSPATIIRLAKKLGYEGYEAFKKDFLEEQKYILTHFNHIDPNFPFTKNDTIQTIASKMTTLSKETLDDTLSLLKHDDLQKANIIHLSAISYSGQIDSMIHLARLAKRKGVSIIVITSLGDNDLRKYGDVVLNISTREKLYSKIGGFVNENSIKLILDILYACYFELNYDDNLNKRINISKESEITRFSSLDIMKESES